MPWEIAVWIIALLLTVGIDLAAQVVPGKISGAFIVG